MKSTQMPLLVNIRSILKNIKKTEMEKAFQVQTNVIFVFLVFHICLCLH